MIWIATGLTAETMAFTLAGFAWFFARGYSFAEAFAAGIVSMFMLFSMIHQLSFLFGSPRVGPILETLALSALFFFGRNRIPQVIKTLLSVKGFFHEERMAGGILAATLVIMAVSIVHSWLSLPLWIQPFSHPEEMYGGQTGSLFELAAIGPVSPLNAVALFNHTARFGLFPNSCGFGLLGVMAVAFSTYALARRYAWPPLALTVSLLILCMPRLIFLGGAPTGELIHAATVCLAMVLIYRLVERHRSMDAIFFILCLCFSIMERSFTIALAPILMLLLVVVMIRRHGVLVGRELAADSAPGVWAFLLPGLVLGQIPVFALNWINDDPLFGFSAFSQTGGIFGASTNLIRYFLSSVDPTEPLQRTFHWLAGVDLNRIFMKGYSLLTSMIPGDSAEGTPFELIISGSKGAGFGPFVLLLVLPSMVYALVRGTRRLKATVVAWSGYLYVTSLVDAWLPGSLEVLTPFITANSFIVAFSMPPWRLRRRGLRLLQLAAGLILFWSIWCFL